MVPVFHAVQCLARALAEPRWESWVISRRWRNPTCRLRMFWWGSKERAERTDKVNKLYQQNNAGLTITGESLGWNDYWPRLATQTAGRNAADVLQMDYRYIFEYARRGALLPLDEYLSKGLNLGDFNKAASIAARSTAKSTVSVSASTPRL